MSHVSSSQKIQAPLLVKGVTKESSWGRVGPESRIFSIAKVTDERSRLAEYWVGAHSSMPARVVLDGIEVPLDRFLRERGAAVLGERVVADFGGELPFLLKILSIDARHGLSIQAHPDPELARRLHANDPTSYPDARHKPEIGLPLSPTQLLYGFKRKDDLRSILSLYPEVIEFTGEGGGVGDEDFYRKALGKLFTLGGERVSRLVTRLAQRVRSEGARSVEAEVFSRLHPQYGDSDEGLLALFLMNVVSVKPGEGIFIPANLPHAYLDGDLVECMACSDNVVRAGLTPKTKDVTTLLEMISYTGTTPTPVLPRVDDDGFLVFPTPTREFKIGYTPRGSKTYRVPARDSVTVVMSLGERSLIRESSGTGALELFDGDAVLLPAGGRSVEVTCCSSSLYRVGVGDR